MNSFEDNYVSFVPMHLSFSPDGRFFLISTGIFKNNIFCTIYVQYNNTDFQY